MLYIIKHRILVMLMLFFCLKTFSQTPLYSGVPVSDLGVNNNIGRANTSRNIAISKDGTIYVVFSGSEGIRVAKSKDRGQSFLPSSLVTPANSEPEIIVNVAGDIFVAWLLSSSVFISKSIDEGKSFSVPRDIGFGGGNAVHMATYGDFIYVIDEFGGNIFKNNSRGDGNFIHITRNNYVYSDIRTDQNGVVYLPSDNPNLFLFESTNSGDNFSQINITPPGEVYFSSYALSDGPCGTFMFIGGGGPTKNEGFKMDVSNGKISPITLGDNNGNNEGRTLFADNSGTLVDGYISSTNDLVINVSYDQGENFSMPIIVAKGVSHNVDRNPFYNDIVVAYEQSGQVYLSVYNDLLKNIKIVEKEFLGLCPGNTFDIPFILSGGFDPSTVFSVYLSDSFGSFDNKTRIGLLRTNSSGNIECTVPVNTVFSASYRIKIESQENCSQSAAIPLPIGSVNINKPSDIFACDDNGDGFSESFDTTLVQNQVLNGQEGLIVSYFDENNMQLPSPLPSPYTNRFATEEIITIRVSKPSADCFSETTLNLKTLNSPIINKPNNIIACGNANGFASFNTTNIESQVIGSQKNLIVRYFDQDNLELPSPLPLSFNNTKAFEQTITVRVEQGALSSCYQETSFDLIVNKFLEIDLKDSYSLCALNPSLVLSVDSSFDTWEWVYQDNTVVSNTFSATLVLEGRYTVNVAKTENGILCENTFTFELKLAELPSIQNVRIQQFSDNNFIELIVTGDGDLEYTIDGENYQDSNIFNNLSGGVYTVKVRDKLGCSEDSQKVVLVNYPKHFSPNNDGVNDYWQIQGIKEYPLAKIHIYDRYGKILKQLAANEIGWDGTFSGREMYASDFWFTVFLDNENRFKGHFSLKR